MKPPPPSFPPNRTNEPEVEQDLTPFPHNPNQPEVEVKPPLYLPLPTAPMNQRSCRISPHKKPNIISLTPPPPPLSPVYQPMDLSIRPHYYPISEASDIQSPAHPLDLNIPSHHSPIFEASDVVPVSACTGSSQQNLLCTCRCHCICRACCPCPCVCGGWKVYI